MKDGSCYPKHGSLDFVYSLVCTIQKNRGKVLVRAPVNKIIIENGKAIGVELPSGPIMAKTVINSAGLVALQKMLPDKF